MTQSNFDIFLSYKREQRHLVEQLYRRLISEGYRVVYDNSMGTRDIVGNAISKWIDSAKLVIVLWTDDSVASEWVRTEARAAVKEKNYLGIVIDDINPKDLPIETCDLNSLNISDGTFENGLSRIVKEVAKRISPDDSAGATADAASGEMVRQNALYMFADRVGSPEAFKQFAAEFDSGVLTQLALQRLKNLPPDPNLEKIQKLEKNLADSEARLSQEKKRLSERSSEINTLETRNARLSHETEALREKST